MFAPNTHQEHETVKTVKNTNPEEFKLCPSARVRPHSKPLVHVANLLNLEQAR
jgi:hypothetical protein